MAVSLTKERGEAILKAKRALEKKNLANKKFVRHKVVSEQVKGARPGRALTSV
jgi:hypothetical protein